jgi:hypothetical protein
MNGAKNWIVFISFAVSVVVFVFYISGRFSAGAAKRHDLCVQVNAIKKILHDEHAPKLKTAQRNLQHYPNGLSIKTDRGSVRISHSDLLHTRDDEAKIVRDTVPEPCP